MPSLFERAKRELAEEMYAKHLQNEEPYDKTHPDSKIFYRHIHRAGLSIWQRMKRFFGFKPASGFLPKIAKRTLIQRLAKGFDSHSSKGALEALTPYNDLTLDSMHRLSQLEHFADSIKTDPAVLQRTSRLQQQVSFTANQESNPTK